MPARTHPSYLDNDLQVVGSDLIELKRHVSGLLNDLTFCTEHNVMQAFQRFEDRVHETFSSIGREGSRDLVRARRLTRRHPVPALLALGAIGLGIGIVVGRPRRPNSEA